KSRSLAGSRIGFALGNPRVIDDLNKIRYSFNPYNLNRLSLLAGEAALKDEEYFEACRRAIMETREIFREALLKLGFSVLPSCANFVFARHPGLAGEEILQKLRDRNILVRHFSKSEICDYVRITIGTPEQMKACSLALGQILEQ
ncbi:MAG: aminotransferase class I/II-fold pyridoxal phosphate-dependent enzyme, partial [Anaerovorax sp.]